MRVRGFATIWVVAMMVATALGSTARAQYDDGLPPGVEQVTVDGQPIDASTTPRTDNRNPDFAGRLTPGPTSVELGLGNGEITRFSLDVDQRGRFRGNAPEPLDPGRYSLYINDALVGEFVITGDEGTPRAAEEGTRLDLARIVPFPFDLADAVPGIAFLDGRYLSVAEEARRTAEAGGDASRAAVGEAADSLRAAGWRQRYESRLAAPKADDPTQFDVQVTSFVIEYTAADNAEAAYDAATEGGEAIAEAATIGDASQLTRLSGVTPDTGAAYRALRLIFRQDRLLAVLVYADLLNREPDQAVMEGLGQAVQERAAAVLAGEVGEWSPLALRMDLERTTGQPRIREAYELLDGQLIAAYGEEERTRSSREAAYAGAAVAYSASFSARVGGGDRGRDATPGADAGGEEGSVDYIVTLYGFNDAGEADAWLSGLGQRLSQDPLRGYLSFTPVDDAPTYGEASATYTFRRRAGGETASGFRVYVRVANTIAAVELSAAPEAPLTAVEELVRTQVECLETGTCPEPAQVPNGLGQEAAGRR